MSSTSATKKHRKYSDKSRRRCLKWPSPALKHADRRRRHWRMAATMTTWSSLARSILHPLLAHPDQWCAFCTPSLDWNPSLAQSSDFHWPAELRGVRPRNLEQSIVPSLRAPERSLSTFKRLLKTQLFQRAWTIVRGRCDWTASSAPHTNIWTQLNSTLFAVFPTCCDQLNSNPANLEVADEVG